MGKRIRKMAYGGKPLRFVRKEKVKKGSLSFDERQAVQNVAYHGITLPKDFLKKPLHGMKSEQLKMMLGTITDYLKKNTAGIAQERRKLLSGIAEKVKTVLVKRQQDLEKQQAKKGQ